MMNQTKYSAHRRKRGLLARHVFLFSQKGLSSSPKKKRGDNYWGGYVKRRAFISSIFGNSWDGSKSEHVHRPSIDPDGSIRVCVNEPCPREDTAPNWTGNMSSWDSHLAGSDLQREEDLTLSNLHSILRKTDPKKIIDRLDSVGFPLMTTKYLPPTPGHGSGP